MNRQRSNSIDRLEQRPHLAADVADHQPSRPGSKDGTAATNQFAAAESCLSRRHIALLVAD